MLLSVVDTALKDKNPKTCPRRSDSSILTYDNISMGPFGTNSPDQLGTSQGLKSSCHMKILLIPK